MVEVILKSKVVGLGAEADVVKVRPGYAMNYLVPRGLAMPATSTYKHQIEQLKKNRATREADELNEANELAKRLNKMTITFQMTAAEGQKKVFGSVTAADIVDRLSKEKAVIEKKQLRLDHPLKDTGTHTVEISLHPEVKAAIKIVLEIPKADEEESDAKPTKAKGPTDRKTGYSKKKTE